MAPVLQIMSICSSRKSFSLISLTVSVSSWDHVYLWEGRGSHHLHLGSQRAAEHPSRPAGRGLQLPAEGRHPGAGGEHPRARRLPAAAYSKDIELLFVAPPTSFPEGNLPKGSVKFPIYLVGYSVYWICSLKSKYIEKYMANWHLFS